MICRICRNDKGNTGYTVREMYFGTREQFEYFQCRACRCLQIRSIPEDMGRYYPKGYYSFGMVDEASFSGRVRKFLRAQRDRNALRGTGVLGMILNGIYPGDTTLGLIARVGDPWQMSILDVGCGRGMLLHQLQELGARRLLGIDPFIERDIEYMNGLKILKRSLQSLKNDPGKKFDLIMFNHSFEHMPDPEAVLQASEAVLAETGTVMIRVPTVDSYAWEHYHEHWVQLDAPRHLYLFSRQSLQILAQRAGLGMNDVVYDSDELQFCGSEQYKRDIPLTSAGSYKHSPSPAPFSKAEMDGFKKRADELNKEGRGDMAAFYLARDNG
ncbi:MAG: class I SAM-dependent methyltransferase [Thermodesulfovibrionales bacterium]